MTQPSDATVPASRYLKPLALDDLLLYNLSRLHARGVGIVTKYCEGRFGITHREWRILAILGGRGTLGSSALAKEAQLDRPRTSRAINSLEHKGLLLRHTPKGDGRLVEVQLSPEGEALYRELFPLVRNINLTLLEELASPEIALLESMLDRLNRRADSLAQDDALPLADRRHGGSRKAPQRRVQDRRA